MQRKHPRISKPSRSTPCAKNNSDLHPLHSSGHREFRWNLWRQPCLAYRGSDESHACGGFRLVRLYAGGTRCSRSCVETATDECPASTHFIFISLAVKLAAATFSLNFRGITSRLLGALLAQATYSFLSFRLLRYFHQRTGLVENYTLPF